MNVVERGKDWHIMRVGEDVLLFCKNPGGTVTMRAFSVAAWEAFGAENKSDVENRSSADLVKEHSE